MAKVAPKDSQALTFAELGDSGGYYNGLVVAAGPGLLPPGGVPGQVLVKVGRADFDAIWATAYITGDGTGGGGTGGDIVLDSIAPIRVSGGGSAWTISIDTATQQRPGSMSAADKRRLDNLPTWRGDTPPAGALIGDLWYDSSIGRLFILFRDASGSVQWVDANPQGAGGQGQGIYFGDQPPADPLAWAGWYDTTIGATFLWYDDGTSQQWVPASPTGAGKKEVYIGSTPPAGVPVESLWWDSNLGRLFILYDDPSGSIQWVDASPDSGSQGQGVYFGDQPPADPLAWAAWFDTSVGALFLWYDDQTSAQWVIAVPQGGENGNLDEGFYGT